MSDLWRPHRQHKFVARFSYSDATSEYLWISSPDGANDVNQLKALARGSWALPAGFIYSTAIRTYLGTVASCSFRPQGILLGHQSSLVHLDNSAPPILSGDVVHSEENLDEDIVPSLNTDRIASIASMDRVRGIIATHRAKLFINHDKAQSDTLRLLPEFYD